VVLDLDTTDAPLHGRKRDSSLATYYNDPAIRRRAHNNWSPRPTAWPHSQIILRADSEFCREEIKGVRKTRSGLRFWVRTE